MGMRISQGTQRAARMIAASLAVIMFISCIGMDHVFADTLSASEKQQQVAEQQAKEQQAQAQREADQKAAQEQVNAQIQYENTNPGVVSDLKATTTESTKGMRPANVKKNKRYVTLTWNAADNADSYVVYYSYSKDGEYKPTKGSVTEPTKKMLFKNDKEVFLKVLPMHGENKGQMSDSVVIWPGYGASVNAMEIKFSKAESSMFTGYTSKFKVNSTASMLKTYKIKWASSNPDVATVKQSGKVTAVANGSTVITAKSHTGFSCSITVTVKTITPSVVPDVKGLTPKEAKKAVKAAGFTPKLKKVFIKKADMEKKYSVSQMGTIMKQSKAAGTSLSQGTKITLTYGDEIYDCGVGVEAMVKWAETVAADNSYGYSMGVYTGRGLDRLCPYTNAGASKDYDCATFVNAALAFSGMGKDFMDATVKPSPVVRGVRDRLVKNGWKKVLIKHKYKKNGKTKYYYTKPTVKQLKRGDIVLNCSCHIQMHVGDGMDVGAHNNYDGKTGDSSGREVSVNYSWTGYNEVYRYYGEIGK